MKKRAIRKDFYVEIRKSLGRFLSIFFIVAMGVAFFPAFEQVNRICDIREMPTLTEIMLWIFAL